ncbi:hypothetical protein BGZ83_004166 [Gryganskiella cystojenkinii]|nr:hypothetical protein BGZ83_004166 [Gryganskiella cystojenkinii]
MVNIEWTPRLEKAFRKVQAQTGNAAVTSLEKVTLQDVKAILSEKAPVCVDMELIKQVSAMLLKYNNNHTQEGTRDDWIHSMIKGSSVYIPKPPPKEPNPELERIMEGIKAQVAEKEYQRMISSIDPHASENLSIGGHLRQDMKEMQEVKSHLTGIVNVLYTGGAVFMAVFMLSAHFTTDLGIRVLLAFLAFVLIVACEAYLYTRHSSIAIEAPKAMKTRYAPKDVVISPKPFSSKEKAS